MKNILFTIAVCSLFVACSKTETPPTVAVTSVQAEGTAPRPPEFPPENAIPPTPAVSASSDGSPFEGMDTNKNGVRDDVESWIVTNVKDRNSQYAAAQIARAMNAALIKSHQSADDVALVAAYQGLQKGYICAAAVAKNGSAGMLVSQVESKMANRDDRIQAYLQLQGRYMKIGFKPLPESQVNTPCEFQIAP